MQDPKNLHPKSSQLIDSRGILKYNFYSKSVEERCIMGLWDKIFGLDEYNEPSLEKASSPDEEYIKFLKDVRNIFPNESLGDIVSFLKDLKGLLPLITSYYSY